MTPVPDWGRVKKTFQEALALPTGERMLRVRQICGDDLTLLAEVESLLDTHAQAGSFAERPAEELLGALALPPTGQRLNRVHRDLPSGTRLGVYEIHSLLGTGGMGEVYQARDTRLDRTVAIKVLLTHADADERARERFEHEARAVAALSHPNICTLYDIGHHDGIDFLVMEYLSGETLAARLARDPMPPELAIVIAAQIASALDAAHRAGVVHRDLKPGNIFLVRTARGSGASTAKLLDFGLAKACQPVIAGIALPDSPPTDLTKSGAIVGTVRYMAPEQVAGKTVDARVDIFAFGAVLYEMLSGHRAFDAESEADVRAAILDEEPTPLATIQPIVPADLTRIVSTCLAKDPDDRWQTARDLLRALTWLSDGHTMPSPAAVLPRAMRRPLLAATAIALAGIAAGAMLSSRFGPAVTGSVTFAIHPPEGTRFPRGTVEMAMSPDGRRLVFVAVSEPGTRRLWMRAFDGISARVIDGTEGAAYPFWSPDGRSIAFFTHGKLKKIPATGGLPEVVCDVLMIGRGGTWNRDGTILFGQGSGPIQRVPDAGGKPTPVTVPDPLHGERVHEWPVFLPDGRRFLYVARSDVPANTGLFQAALDSRQRTRLPPLTSNVAVVGTHLLALGNRSLLAHAYDSDRARVTGAPITVAEQMAYDSLQRSAGAFSAAPGGALAYRSANPDSRLIWFDRTGREVGGSGWSDYHHPWLAPDETRVAVERTDASTGRHTIWILDVLRGVTSRLVADASGAHMPVWSPDGTRVLYSSNRLGGIDLYRMRADGAGGEELVLSSPARVRHVPTDWSLDGRSVLFEFKPNEDSDLWVLSLKPGKPPQPFLDSKRSQEVQGRFSPDSRWVAYASDESGSFEVYVRRFPSADGKWQVSTHGGAQPQWRRDGKELFYLAPDGRLMAARVTSAGSRFETGTPSRVFDTGITGAFIDRRNQYVVTRDGQRFLVNVSAEDTNPTPITVVLNWAANQKR